jgi:signal peptidase II
MSKNTQMIATPFSYSFFGIAFFLLMIDQLSKALVCLYLPILDSTFYFYPYGGIGIFKNLGGIEFSINYITNTGAAWGTFGHYPLPLMILRVGLISGLCLYLFYFNTRSFYQLPLIFIISGAISNVLDFFIHGHVVDMFHFVFWGYDFPVFNLADTMISLGIGLWFVLSWWKENQSCLPPL